MIMMMIVTTITRLCQFIATLVSDISFNIVNIGTLKHADGLCRQLKNFHICILYIYIYIYICVCVCVCVKGKSVPLQARGAQRVPGS